MTDLALEQCLNSSEPAIRYKATVNVMRCSPDSGEALNLRQRIPGSSLVQTLLSDRNEGRIPYHPYSKWLGAHWVLACLADLGYPPGDRGFQPLFEQVYAWLLSKGHLENVKTIAGRARRCASQEGNALYAAIALGLADQRSQELAERLIRWQWPDGGWNCDRRPEAENSSFMETLTPMRGLAFYARASGDPAAGRSVELAAQVFLKRFLYKRQSDGSVISQDFIKLHYPCYWHYDILFGLKVMAEAGFIEDPRCQPALDLLETKRLPGGGFPAEARYYHLTDRQVSGRSRVDWGGTSKVRWNEFVTVDALSVLKASGRLID